MHVLEISKIKDSQMLEDELAQWLKFIENPGNKEVEKFMSENRFLKQAKEELAYLSGDPDFQLLVESRAGMLKDIYYFQKEAEEKALSEGIEKGKKEQQIEIAKKLLELEVSIDKIIAAQDYQKKKLKSYRKN